MRLHNSDLLLATGSAVLYTGCTFLPASMSLVGLLLALPMVFFVPGYTLTAILAHKRTLDGSHRLLLSLGLSLALDILCGCFLNLLPIGLRALSWVLVLSGVTVLFALIIIYLRRGIVPAQTPAAGMRNGANAIPVARIVRGGILSAFALALIICALLYTVQSVAQQPANGFTQLWLLPPTQTTQGCTVRVGLHSFETTPVTYRVLATINDVQANMWPTLALAPNQVWEQGIAVPPVATAKYTSIQVKVFRGDKPNIVYRKVNVTILDAKQGCRA